MKLPQTSHWYYVHRYFILVAAILTLIPIIRSLLFIIINNMQFQDFAETQLIYLKHDILRLSIWCIIFLLLLLTYLFQKKSRKSTLVLIYIQNVLFPLFIILYTMQTNHMYYELLKNGFYKQVFENNPKIVYDVEIIREKLDDESLIRMLRMGLLLLVVGTALTFNSVYFTKRKSLFQDDCEIK